MSVTNSLLVGRINALSRRVALVSLVAMVAAGCGRAEKQVPVVPVTGSISFQGKPPAGAQIVLHAASGSETDAVVAPVGLVKPDGSFEISTYGEGDGAPAGEYTATVQWFKLVSGDGGSGRGPNVLPPKYSQAQTSPIKVAVKTEATQLPPIVIAY